MSVSGLDRVNAQVRETVLRLPLMLGNHMVNFSKDSFRVQGWRGSTFQPWAQRKIKTKNQGRAILIRSGRLRRSPYIVHLGSSYVTIGSDVPYAQIHNQGGTINMRARQRVIHFKATRSRTRFSKEKNATFAQKVNVGGYQVNMPRRQFMPESANDSPVLRKQLEDLVLHELEKIKA